MEKQNSKTAYVFFLSIGLCQTKHFERNLRFDWFCTCSVLPDHWRNVQVTITGILYFEIRSAKLLLLWGWRCNDLKPARKAVCNHWANVNTTPTGHDFVCGCPVKDGVGRGRRGSLHRHYNTKQRGARGHITHVYKINNLTRSVITRQK